MTSAPSSWIRLAVILSDCRGDATKFAKQEILVLDGLKTGRFRYRYLDERGIRRENDLPELFWDFAHIHWLLSCAVWEARSLTAQQVEVLLSGSATASNTVGRGSADWIVAELRRMERGGELNKFATPTKIAKSIAERMTKAVKAGECRCALTYRSILNKLKVWAAEAGVAIPK
jgi:hypothetical protein